MMILFSLLRMGIRASQNAQNTQNSQPSPTYSSEGEAFLYALLSGVIVVILVALVGHHVI
jgi:hypothetical protein